jgi:hypothetical protein
MFRSFYMAGFECATGYNRNCHWIDQVEATQHDLFVDADYARLHALGIRTVREAVRWPLVDRSGACDFASVKPMLAAARAHEMDVIWDLFHYGYPGDTEPFAPDFAERFAHYCGETARFLSREGGSRCFITPVNEPSYLAWAGGSAGLFAPHRRDVGFELKVALTRAAIAGIRAIQRVNPSAVIVNVDPLCRVVPRDSTRKALAEAQHFNERAVFEFYDLLSGRLMPELGGSPELIGVMGLNYYWTNQWQLGKEGCPLHPADPRYTPLGELLRQVYARYGAPLVLTETSALGDARASWVDELAEMAHQLELEGVPLHGICLYPILGMPEWHEPEVWTQLGLWELERRGPALERVVHAPMQAALERAIQRKKLQRGAAFRAVNRSYPGSSAA